MTILLIGGEAVDVNNELDRLIAPWTIEQVASINEFQRTVLRQNSYHCPLNSNHKPMIAIEMYLMCPDCDSKQYWCNIKDADGSWRTKRSDPPPAPPPSPWGRWNA